MTHSAERPFLGKGVDPIPVVGAGEGIDMLDHTGFLIVSLFQKETIVLNLSPNG
jgi:hypothetical protein